MKNNHKWDNKSFIKDKTQGTCSRCGLTREMRLEFKPFSRRFYVYGENKTKQRPDCIQPIDIQQKLF